MGFNGGKTLSFSIKANTEENVSSECCVFLPICFASEWKNEKKKNIKVCIDLHNNDKAMKIVPINLEIFLFFANKIRLDRLSQNKRAHTIVVTPNAESTITVILYC